MNWNRLRTGLLCLALVWSAVFPFAADALARVSGDESWLLCAPRARAELGAEDTANLAILAELAGQSAAGDAGLPVPVCDDCLACPVIALPVAALSELAPPDAHALLQHRRTGLLAALQRPRLRPDARGPPRSDHTPV
ncbi:hypothetical protein [Maricaulis sp.]|uniref:hypothetical protein n=1 Tax=Maricaulis sp. TaxID=1486257 RepID=UPI0025BDB9A6|nr:hypothetical protein [Maricaulis sp.]